VLTCIGSIDGVNLFGINMFFITVGVFNLTDRVRSKGGRKSAYTRDDHGEDLWKIKRVRRREWGEDVSSRRDRSDGK